ncbi:MAG TPA: hypothetical protein VFX37_10610 [Pseudolabrys sp.]|nr:hypothetical protein [Pseudolabrys sp.]
MTVFQAITIQCSGNIARKLGARGKGETITAVPQSSIAMSVYGQTLAMSVKTPDGETLYWLLHREALKSSVGNPANRRAGVVI